MRNKYFQCLIFPIIPIVFTLLWIIFAGYETNISKEYTNKYIRILFFLIAILALLFPYIESTIIKNMHLLFAYTTLVLYIFLIKDIPQFFQYRMLFFAACIFCFFDCILQMKITGLSEIIFLWVNAYILTK